MKECEVYDLREKYPGWDSNVIEKAKIKEKEWNFIGSCYFILNHLLEVLPSPKKYPNIEEMIEDYSRIVATDYLLDTYYESVHYRLEKKGFDFKNGYIFMLKIDEDSGEEYWEKVKNNDSLLLNEYWDCDGLVAYDKYKVYIYHRTNDQVYNDIVVAYKSMYTFINNCNFKGIFGN